MLVYKLFKLLNSGLSRIHFLFDVEHDCLIPATIMYTPQEVSDDQAWGWRARRPWLPEQSKLEL